MNDREGRPGQNGRPVEAKLLVVDDEPNIVELLSASLRYAGPYPTAALWRTLTSSCWT